MDIDKYKIKYEQKMHHYLTHLNGYRYAYIKTCCEEILSHCDDEIIDYLKSKPDAAELHFSLGMWIRNHYIYNNMISTTTTAADDASNEVIYWLIYYLNNELKVDKDYNEEEDMKKHSYLMPVNELIYNLKNRFAENPAFRENNNDL